MPAPRNTRQIETLDKLQRQDHDSLVRIEEVMKGIALDVRDLKDGTAVRLAEIEMRMKENRTKIDANAAEIDRFKTALNVGKWIVGVQTATISFMLASLSGVIDLFRN